MSEHPAGSRPESRSGSRRVRVLVAIVVAVVVVGGAIGAGIAIARGGGLTAAPTPTRSAPPIEDAVVPASSFTADCSAIDDPVITTDRSILSDLATERGRAAQAALLTDRLFCSWEGPGGDLQLQVAPMASTLEEAAASVIDLDAARRDEIGDASIEGCADFDGMRCSAVVQVGDRLVRMYATAQPTDSTDDALDQVLPIFTAFATFVEDSLEPRAWMPDPADFDGSVLCGGDAEDIVHDALGLRPDPDLTSPDDAGDYCASSGSAGTIEIETYPSGLWMLRDDQRDRTFGAASARALAVDGAPAWLVDDYPGHASLWVAVGGSSVVVEGDPADLEALTTALLQKLAPGI